MIIVLLLAWAGAQLEAPVWYWILTAIEAARWVHKNVKLKLDPNLFEKE